MMLILPSLYWLHIIFGCCCCQPTHYQQGAAWLLAPCRHLVVFTHRFVGLLLACMFGCSAGIGAHLHMHGVDYVKEVFNHGYALQGGVLLGWISIRTLKHRETGVYYVVKLQDFLFYILLSSRHTRNLNERQNDLSIVQGTTRAALHPCV